MTERAKPREGLLDEVERLHERRARKKPAKKRDELDLDGVWGG